jgi:hypothetical protein
MYIETKITPIESIYDVRLVTLLNVLMGFAETVSLSTNCNAEQLISDSLYLTTKKIHEIGEQDVLDKMLRCYPILQEALD